MGGIHRGMQGNRTGIGAPWCGGVSMTPTEMEYLLSCGANPLELSIAKWADIVNGVGEDALDTNCALCATFRNYLCVRECTKCPVSIQTGDGLCKGTPYMDYFEDPTIENALAEMHFLQSLRHQEGRK